MAKTESRTVKLSQVSRYVRHHFRSRQPVMIWGSPGIGKSDIIEQICESMALAPAEAKKRGLLGKSKLVDVRLPLWDPTDIKGIPYFDHVSNTMAWAPPGELPNLLDAENNDFIILFLDEINGAAPAVQAAAYQLILNRRVGTYNLPDNVFIVAAGNRDGDRGVTHRMPKPLQNRFVHYEVEVNFDDWLDWATSNNIHPEVIGFLTYSKSKLHSFDAKSADPSYPTPRSWKFVSDLLNEVDGKTKSPMFVPGAPTTFDQSAVTDMVSGAVGQGVALEFQTHRAVSGKLPNPADILSGKVKELKTSEISAKYTLVTNLAYELRTIFLDEKDTKKTSDEFTEMLGNVLTFWMDNLEPEMVVMGTRLILQKYNINADLRKTKCFKRFMDQYSSLIMDA